MDSRVTIDGCEFLFKCPQKWDALETTADPGVRFCSECERSVYFAEDKEAAGRLSALGKCVALRTDRNRDRVTLGMMAAPKNERPPDPSEREE
ncbi:MAG: hypothetical protein KF756_02605 [Acidobacteria bacterium]|nr:hypothetical protein [Acidobacteriota bacterium]